MGMLRVALLSLAACGRFGFDATSDGTPSDVRIDAPGDATDGGPDACAGRLFCDGFDDDLSRWDGISAAGATVRHEPAFGRAGGSLHALAPVGTTIATLYKDVFTTLPPELYVRMYLYAPSGMVLDLEALELADVAGTHQIVFSIYDTDIDIHAHSMAGDFIQRSPMDMPRDRWVCMELHVRVAVDGGVELFVDDQWLLAQTAVDTRPPTGDLSRLRVGIPSKPTSLAAELFVDDVIVDTERIGCN